MCILSLAQSLTNSLNQPTNKHYSLLASCYNLNATAMESVMSSSYKAHMESYIISWGLEEDVAAVQSGTLSFEGLEAMYESYLDAASAVAAEVDSERCLSIGYGG